MTNNSFYLFLRVCLFHTISYYKFHGGQEVVRTEQPQDRTRAGAGKCDSE